MILGIDPGPERCGVVLYDEVVDHGEGFLMGKRA